MDHTDDLDGWIASLGDLVADGRAREQGWARAGSRVARLVDRHPRLHLLGMRAPNGAWSPDPQVDAASFARAARQGDPVGPHAVRFAQPGGGEVVAVTVGAGGGPPAYVLLTTAGPLLPADQRAIEVLAIALHALPPAPTARHVPEATGALAAPSWPSPARPPVGVGSASPALVDLVLFEPDRAHARRLAHADGFDVEAPRLVTYVCAGPGRAEGDAVEVVRAALAVGRGNALSTAHDGGALVVLDREPIWEPLRRALGSVLGPCTVAVSAWHGSVDTLDQAVGEARRAARLALPAAPATLVRYDELGVMQVLTDAHPSRLSSFAERWLGDLLAYDRAHGGELVASLSAYLGQGGSLDRAAGELGIHRSTLKYRLRRIGEVSGLDLGDPDVRFNLQLATRTLVVLDQGDGGGDEGPGPAPAMA